MQLSKGNISCNTILLHMVTHMISGKLHKQKSNLSLTSSGDNSSPAKNCTLTAMFLADVLLLV